MEWQLEWNVFVNEGETPLTELRPVVNQFRDIQGLSRLESLKWTRLRLGHTKFSKQHLVKNEAALECLGCSEELTVKHVLIECGDFYVERRQFLGMENLEIKEILNSIDINYIKNVFKFFREINLYDMI